jgi:adenylate cyclase
MAAAEESTPAVLRRLIPGAPRSQTALLARYLRTRWGLGMFAANLAGAVDVFILLGWILPTPEAPAGDDTVLRHTIAFVAFMAITFPIGGWGTVRAAKPVLDWLDRGGPPTPTQRRAALLLPARQTLMHAAMWLLAAAFFAALDLHVSGELARYEFVTIVMGALTTCALTYLLAERVLRPVTALALDGNPPKQPVGPGVKGRLVLAWITASGVPLVGLALVGIDVATRADLTRSRIASSILVLSALAIAVGLAATIIAAKSVAEPVWAVRRALARVEEGDLDIDVRVDDASEIGLLQSGFNRMAAGLRERERLRDLFGRHVGEDVARAALDAGELALGGEVREVAVLFVDLTGSTAMAGRRPPEEVVSLLNRFFGVVVDVVGAHGGWINKFEGDGALCVFGAPVEQADAAAAALATSRALHARLVRELPEVDAGIGVSAGRAVAGNVGAEERFEYTVIGDPVNEAARLCERAKGAPSRVLASEAILERAGPAEAARWQLEDEVLLRGRREPTRTAAPLAA